MKIYYRESDSKFCGSANINKKVLGNDKVKSIEIEEEEWMNFIQTAQEIYIEDGKLVSKKAIAKVIPIAELKELKIQELRKKELEKLLDERCDLKTKEINKCENKTALNKVEV